MGEVICLRAFHYVRDCDMTWEQARCQVGIADWKRAYKWAMDEQDRLKGMVHDQSKRPLSVGTQRLMMALPEDTWSTPAEAS